MPPRPDTREPGCAGLETTEHDPSSAVPASTSPSVGNDSGSQAPSGPSAAAEPESTSAAPPAVTAPVLDAAPTSPCAAHDTMGASAQAANGTTVVEEEAAVVEEDEEKVEVDDSASTGAMHTSGSQQVRSADDDAVEGGELEDSTESSLYCSDVDSVDDHDALAVDAAVASVVLDVDVTGGSEHRAEGAQVKDDTETFAPVLELVHPVSAAPSPPPAAQPVGDAAQDAEGDANQGKSCMPFLYCTAGPRPAATCMLQRREVWCSLSLVDALDL